MEVLRPRSAAPRARPSHDLALVHREQRHAEGAGGQVVEDELGDLVAVGGVGERLGELRPRRPWRAAVAGRPRAAAAAETSPPAAPALGSRARRARASAPAAPIRAARTAATRARLARGGPGGGAGCGRLRPARRWRARPRSRPRWRRAGGAPGRSPWRSRRRAAGRWGSPSRRRGIAALAGERRRRGCAWRTPPGSGSRISAGAVVSCMRRRRRAAGLLGEGVEQLRLVDQPEPDEPGAEPSAVPPARLEPAAQPVRGDRSPLR